MSVLEIILLIIGALIFILSFLIPVKQEETAEDIQDMVKSTVKQQVADEISGVRSHVDDVVDEAVEYAQEKTERSLERITNEKIMAVNEYSETVLAEIRKNQEEVMFLYDMLNDKHEDLKDAVAEVNETVKTVEETVAAIPTVTVTPTVTPTPVQKKAEEAAPAPNIRPLDPPRVTLKPAEGVRTLSWAAMAEAAAMVNTKITNQQSVDDDFISNEVENIVENNNQQDENIPQNAKVLEMASNGYDSITIARTLGIGVGEVELIMNLNTGRK